jgi:calcium-dependent protein kinase
VLKRKYDEKCDVWSCGIILYVLLCGYPPFNGASDAMIMEKVSKGVFNFDGEEWINVSHEAKNLISNMLQIDPQKRFTAQQALNDPWLKKNFANTDQDLALMSKALGNMKTFRAGRKLQEATWVFLVNYLASKEEKSQLLKIFQSLDLNGDGQLSREELITGYKKTMNEVQANEIVDHIMQTVHKNNNGAIDYTGFFKIFYN